MESLSSGPVADVLERLHQEAAAADASLMQTYAGENTSYEQASGYIDYVRNPRNGYLSLPLPFEQGRGNELTIKIN